MADQNHIFLKDWKKHQRKIIQTMYPELDKKEIKEFLTEVVDEKLVNPEAKMHNNYAHMQLPVDLLHIIDWFNDTKPIGAGFGVFFKNQDQVLNPAAVMLDNFLKLRKSYKSQLHVYNENSYEYATFDRKQSTEKINANSYYGASGAPTSNFFNIYTATSTTATGQSLISTTEQAFESFLSNSVYFIDLDDCLNFLENIRKEKHSLDDRFLPNVSVEQMINHLSKTFYTYDVQYTPILFDYLMGIEQNVLNRMYFKNNIYEFSFLPKIRYILVDIMRKTDEFKDPNKLPKNAKGDLETLWEYYKEFVLYNNFSFGRIQRLKNDKRKTVVTVDTDSNMLNLNPWVKFMEHAVVSVNDDIAERDPNEVRFIVINIMCYVITNMVTEVLNKYTKNSNILKDFRPKINMKNEFLFTRLILSPKKKRYISSVRLREGKEIYPEKIDIKGMDFVKSTTREETKAYFMNLVKEELLYKKDVNISTILRRLEEFEGIIMESLRKGEKSFLIPKSVKELEAYDDPFREQGVRGVLAWNYMFPSMEIQLPEKIDIVKVKMKTIEDVADLEKTNPEIYERIKKNIYNSRNKKIADKGIETIAIPRNVKDIPDWLASYIDYDTIVNDNIGRFYSVLESLGVETIKASTKRYFTNILKV
jgi:DNA polymerase family B